MLCFRYQGTQVYILQVQTWMKEAESTKGLLATKEIDDAATRAVTESQEQCVIQ